MGCYETLSGERWLRPWRAVDGTWIDEGNTVATWCMELDGIDVVEVVGVAIGGDGVPCH
jgi:hypothetical protein